jgi:hypothetical protein
VSAGGRTLWVLVLQRVRVLTVPRGPAGVARLDDYASSPRILPDEVSLG